MLCAFGCCVHLIGCCVHLICFVRHAVVVLSRVGGAADPHTFLQRLSLNIVMRLTYGVRYASEEIKQKNSPMGQLLGECAAACVSE